jgi:hypothetical protein
MGHDHFGGRHYTRGFYDYAWVARITRRTTRRTTATTTTDRV